MQDIIPDKNRMKIFEAIVANGLEFVSKEGEVMMTMVPAVMAFVLIMNYFGYCNVCHDYCV